MSRRNLSCIRPACQNQPLREIEIESTWTFRRFVCPQCGRPYNIPTPVGKAAQVGPLVSVGIIATGVIMADWERVVDHVADALS